MTLYTITDSNHKVVMIYSVYNDDPLLCLNVTSNVYNVLFVFF